MENTAGWRWAMFTRTRVRGYRTANGAQYRQLQRPNGQARAKIKIKIWSNSRNGIVSKTKDFVSKGNDLVRKAKDLVSDRS